MSSIAKTTTRSKKTKRLGPVQVIRPDQYEAFDVDSKLECTRALIPLGLMHVQEVLEEEVYRWAGARYAPKTPDLPGRRHGSNPGSVQLAGQRHPLRIQRVQYKTGGEISLHALTTSGGPGTWRPSYSSGYCMGFPVGTMRPRRSPSRGPLGYRVRRCREPSRMPVRSNFKRSKIVTYVRWTWWRSFWTARPSPT